MAIVLSVSGETQEVIRLTGRLKEHCCRIISITNRASTTLGKITDYNLNYYVTGRKVEGEYDVTTQVPVIVLLENLGRRLS